MVGLSALLPAVSQAAPPDGRNSYRGGPAAAAPTLVEDVANARVLWKSPESIGDGKTYDHRFYSTQRTDHVCSGYATPLVADGRVYYFGYVPAGDVADEELAAKERQLAAEDKGRAGPQKWRIEADDVLWCFDAESGEILWKKVWPGRSLNRNATSKGNPTLTPVIVGDVVCCLGNTGWLSAVHGETGEELWTTRLPGAEKHFDAIRTKAITEKRIRWSRSDQNVHLLQYDGVLLVGGFLHGELLAYDIGTGKLRWSRANCADSPIPTIWDGPDGAVVITSHRHRGLFATRLADGEAVWELPAYRYALPRVIGDRLLAGIPDEDHTLVCLRFDRSKPRAAPEVAWTCAGALSNCELARVGDRLLAFHGGGQVSDRLILIGLDSGKIIDDLKLERPLPGSKFGSMTVAGDRVIYTDRSRTRMFRVGKTVELLSGRDDWRFAIGYFGMKIRAPVVDGVLYIRGTDRLMAIDFRANTAKPSQADAATHDEESEGQD